MALRSHLAAKTLGIRATIFLENANPIEAQKRFSTWVHTLSRNSADLAEAFERAREYWSRELHLFSRMTRLISICPWAG